MSTYCPVLLSTINTGKHIRKAIDFFSKTKMKIKSSPRIYLSELLLCTIGSTYSGFAC